MRAILRTINKRYFATNAIKLIRNSNVAVNPNLGGSLMPTMKPDVLINHQVYSFEKNRSFVHLRFFSEINYIRPTNFILAIDTSGSMSEPCTDSTSADPECKMYSRMDLVKHSANTIIECLRPEDSISIVSFSTKADVVYYLGDMSGSNKLNIKKTLEKLEPTAMTNLWEGLSLSMDELQKVLPASKDKNNFVVLLSDGLPNQNPPRGILHEYLKKISTQGLSYPISNFGYGYDLDSKLLADLSSNGGGLFAHIPDHSMCNTVFINYLTTCLATVKNKIKLKLHSINTNDSIQNISIPNYELVNQSYIDLGSLQSGITRNVLIKVDHPEILTNEKKPFQFNIHLDIDGEEIIYLIEGQISKTSTPIDLMTLLSSNKIADEKSKSIEGNNESVYIYLVHHLINILQQGLKDLPSTTVSRLDAFIKVLDDLIPFVTDPTLQQWIIKLRKNIQDAENDNNGQIYKAFAKTEWYNRWGKHYIRYFISSILSEKCSNFKDLAFEKYSNAFTERIRTEIEEIFFDIPPPVPSLSGNQNTQAVSGNFVNYFYSSSGPCFDGNGTVQVLNGLTGLFEKKFVKDVCKGDKILNSEGQVSTIVCVLKTKIQNGKAHMNEFHGMKITPWHPVRLLKSSTPSKWSFPINFQNEPKEIDIDWFYDFVLDQHHIITINDCVDVIGLGHGITHDPVLAHPFFGTDEVIKELQKDPIGWAKGEVVIEEYKPVYFQDETHPAEPRVLAFSL